MLSCHEIIDAFDEPDETGRCLSVIPEPDRSEVLKRGGTSIDLRLGRWFRSFKQTHSPSFSLAPPRLKRGKSKPLDWASSFKTKQHFVPFGKPFVIHPGSFVLGTTLEWLDIPPTLSAYVTGKSTLGRHGLVIETAAGIHPLFSGCLTLELANVGEIPLEIHPGMKICQIFFHRTSPCMGTTNSGASGQRKPVLPKPSDDRVFSRILDSHGASE
jgi:dCTP deaminase